MEIELKPKLEMKIEIEIELKSNLEIEIETKKWSSWKNELHNNHAERCLFKLTYWISVESWEASRRFELGSVSAFELVLKQASLELKAKPVELYKFNSSVHSQC